MASGPFIFPKLIATIYSSSAFLIITDEFFPACFNALKISSLVAFAGRVMLLCGESLAIWTEEPVSPLT